MLNYCTPNDLAEILRPMQPFYFLPNVGNLGDLLLAVSIRRFFQQHGLTFREYHPELPPQEKHCLVHGGGGCSHHWGYGQLKEQLTAPNVESCVILPHSFSGVDELLAALDERHTVLCREEASYDQACRINKKSRILLADDCGLMFDMGTLPPYPAKIPAIPSPPTKDDRHSFKQLMRGLREKMMDGVRCASVAVKPENKLRQVGFILRQDVEKATDLCSPLAFDLSRCWSGDCCDSVFSNILLRCFADALNQVDIVVTDRLHVSIMGHLLGKEVYMMDNDYGKLGGVYQLSLRSFPNIHYVGNGELPPQLQDAWAQLNSPEHLEEARLQRGVPFPQRWMRECIMKFRLLFRC